VHCRSFVPERKRGELLALRSERPIGGDRQSAAPLRRNVSNAASNSRSLVASKPAVARRGCAQPPAPGSIHRGIAGRVDEHADAGRPGVSSRSAAMPPSSETTR